MSILVTVASIGVFVSKSAFAGPEVSVMTSSSIPPYAIAAQNNGIVVDVLTSAFAWEGVSVRFLYASNRRVAQEFDEGHVDGVYNLPCTEDRTERFFSVPIIDYAPVVVTLESNHLSINRIEDLDGKRLVAFQRARDFLPQAAQALVEADHSYSEVSDQSLQVEMLLAGHADAIIIDERIFTYYYQRTIRALTTSDRINIHHLFLPMRRCAVFRSKSNRDVANRGIEHVRATGEYDLILARYKSEHSLPVVSLASDPMSDPNGRQTRPMGH